MRTGSTPLENTCLAVIDAVDDLGFSAPWHVRFRAAQLLIAHITQSVPTVQVVRGIVYGRSALFRLGGALIPRTQEELAQFHEQVGPALVLLGYDQPHAVLIVGPYVVELTCWNDHDDPGVLIHPFVGQLPVEPSDEVVIDDVPIGAAVAYQLQRGETLPSLNRTYEQMARQLAASAAPRIRWQLDSRRPREESA